VRSCEPASRLREEAPPSRRSSASVWPSWRPGTSDADAVESNRQSQRAFVWLFLKMLVAQQHLGSEDAKAMPPGSRPSARRSKSS